MSVGDGVTVRRALPDDRDRLLDLKCTVWPELVRANEVARWNWEFDDNPSYDSENSTTLVIEDAADVSSLVTSNRIAGNASVSNNGTLVGTSFAVGSWRAL